LLLGDKIMQIGNDYENERHDSDIGDIDDVDPNAGELAGASYWWSWSVRRRPSVPPTGKGNATGIGLAAEFRVDL